MISGPVEKGKPKFIAVKARKRGEGFPGHSRPQPKCGFNIRENPRSSAAETLRPAFVAELSPVCNLKSSAGLLSS